MLKRTNTFVTTKELPIYNISLIEGKEFKYPPESDYVIPKGTVVEIHTAITNKDLMGTHTDVTLIIQSDRDFIYTVKLFDDSWQDYFLQGKAVDILYGRN